MNEVLAWYYQQSFFFQIGIGYLVVINAMAFLFYGFDKMQAKLGNRRVRERTLWFIAGIGGSLGAMIGVEFFSHKTRKSSFLGKLFLIFFIHIGIIAFFFVR